MQIEKQVLVAGTDWEWTETVSGYPASTHTLKYLLKKGSEKTITLTSTPDGNDHKFEIAKSTTTGKPSGFYHYQAIAVLISDSTNINNVDKPGLIEIHPDLSTVSDARTHAMIMVDNIRTALQKLSAKTMDAVSIDGITYNYKDMERLKSLLGQYEREAGIKKNKILRLKPITD